jgi:hypothetical protein
MRWGRIWTDFGVRKPVRIAMTTCANNSALAAIVVQISPAHCPRLFAPALKHEFPSLFQRTYLPKLKLVSTGLRHLRAFSPGLGSIQKQGHLLLMQNATLFF